MIIWLTGYSGSGKTTLVKSLKNTFDKQCRPSIILDGDDLRKGLSSDLDLSEESRHEQSRRTAEVAKILSSNHIIALVALVSPYKKDREFARTIAPNIFMEVYLDTPIEVCEHRDVKGLYRKVRRGEITNFTGISAVYEPSLFPDIRLNTNERSIYQCVETILQKVNEFSTFEI